MVQLSSRQIKLSSGATAVLTSSLDHPLATVLPRWMPPVEKVFADPRGKAMAMAILPPGISEDCREHHLNSENTIGGRVKSFLALKTECQLTPTMALGIVAATVKLCEILEKCSSEEVNKFFKILADRCNSRANFRNVEQTILRWVKLLTPDDGKPNPTVLSPLWKIEAATACQLQAMDLRNIESDFIPHEHGNRYLWAVVRCVSAFGQERRQDVHDLLRDLQGSPPHSPIHGLPEDWACLALDAINGRKVYQSNYDFLMQTRDPAVLSRPATKLNYENMVSAERASCVIRETEGRQRMEGDSQLALRFVQQLNELSDGLIAAAEPVGKAKGWESLSPRNQERIQHLMQQVRTLSEGMSIVKAYEKSPTFTQRAEDYKQNISALRYLGVLDSETCKQTFELLRKLVDRCPRRSFAVLAMRGLVKAISRQVEITPNCPEVYEFLSDLIEKLVVRNVPDLANILSAALDRAAKEAPGTYSPVFWKQLKVTVKQPQKTK